MDRRKIQPDEKITVHMSAGDQESILAFLVPVKQRPAGPSAPVASYSVDEISSPTLPLRG